MNSIPIYLISYYFNDVIIGVVDRLNEITKCPIKIIIGDNLSKNSTTIRENLIKYKKENKIHAAYFYPENHGTKILKHMIYEANEKSDYIVIGDGDALISEKFNCCWLTDFLKILEENINIGLIGFQSKNEQLLVAMATKSLDFKTFKIDNVKKYETYHPKQLLEKNKPCPIRGHFLTMKKSLLESYYLENIDNGATYDGSLQRFLAKKGYLIAKYLNSFTYNLGTIKSGYDCDRLSRLYSFDLSYKEIRKTKVNYKQWNKFNFPTKFEKI